MSDQSQWRDLQRNWQAPPDHPLPELSLVLGRRTRTIWLLTALDALGTVAIFVAAVWVLLNDFGEFEQGLAWLALGLIIVCWVCVLYVRRGTWRLTEAAPVATEPCWLRCAACRWPNARS